MVMFCCKVQNSPFREHFLQAKIFQKPTNSSPSAAFLSGSILIVFIILELDFYSIVCIALEICEVNAIFIEMILSSSPKFSVDYIGDKIK